MKALPVGEGSILVSWKRPLHLNGIILKYTVYMKYENADSRKIEQEFNVQPQKLSYLVRALQKNYEYHFAVTATTSRGEGEKTREVKQTPVKEGEHLRNS